MKCYIMRNSTVTRYPHEGCTLQHKTNTPEIMEEFESLAEARKALDKYKCTCHRIKPTTDIMYKVTEYYIADIHGDVWTFAEQEGE